MEVTELILMALVILYGSSILIITVTYNSYRNIYTQKIIYMNDEMRKIDDKLNYSISPFKKFKPRIKFEEEYPPIIKERNLQNPDYKFIVDSFNNYLIKRDRRIRRLSVIFGILLIFMSAIHLINKLGLIKLI